MLTGLMKKYTLYECFVHLRGGPGVFLTSLKTRRTGSPSIAWQMGTKPSMHTLRNGVLPLPHLHASQAPPPQGKRRRRTTVSLSSGGNETVGHS